MKEMLNVENSNGVTTITATSNINLRKDQVWEFLRLPGKIQDFHPLIKQSSMIGSEQYGIGATRQCDLLPMGQMNERIIDWDEGSAFTTEVIGGKMLPPYKFMKGRVNLSEKGDTTDVSFSFSYQIKFGFLGQWMDFLFIRPQFKNAPVKYVMGLREYAEQHVNDSKKAH